MLNYGSSVSPTEMNSPEEVTITLKMLDGRACVSQCGRLQVYVNGMSNKTKQKHELLKLEIRT